MRSFEDLLNSILSLPVEEAKKKLEAYKEFLHAEKSVRVGSATPSAHEEEPADGVVVSPEGEKLSGFSVVTTNPTDPEGT